MRRVGGSAVSPDDRWRVPGLGSPVSPQREAYTAGFGGRHRTADRCYSANYGSAPRGWPLQGVATGGAPIPTPCVHVSTCWNASGVRTGLFRALRQAAGGGVGSTGRRRAESVGEPSLRRHLPGGGDGTARRGFDGRRATFRTGTSVGAVNVRTAPQAAVEPSRANPHPRPCRQVLSTPQHRAAARQRPFGCGWFARLPRGEVTLPSVGAPRARRVRLTGPPRLTRGSAGSGPRTPVHRLYTTGARPVHDRRTGRLRRARRPGKASPTSRAGTVARGEWGGGSPSPLVQFSGPTHALLMEASAGPRAQAHGRAHDHTPGARAARRGTPLYDDFFTRISADCRAPRDGWHVTPARTCPPPCAVVRTPHGIPGAYRASAPGARRAPVPVQRPAPAPQFATPAPDSPPCTPHIRLVRTSCTPRTLFAYALYTERMHLPPPTYPANPRTPLPEPRHRPHAAPSPATPAHPRQIPPRPPAAPGPRSRPVPRTVSPPPRHPRAPTCTAVPSAHAHSDGRQAPTTRSAQPRTGSRALRTDTNPAIPAGAP
ncbi:hypothetical protein K378_02986 [Streptomyces sp. Amel2xB2]|nr:hypothetical protein K378_02986 [Streptomyces sp. Amel2xB2]